jgi:hypothetical protein
LNGVAAQDENSPSLISERFHATSTSRGSIIKGGLLGTYFKHSPLPIVFKGIIPAEKHPPTVDYVPFTRSASTPLQQHNRPGTFVD